jgi:hypothetical protein
MIKLTNCENQPKLIEEEDNEKIHAIFIGSGSRPVGGWASHGTDVD